MRTFSANAKFSSPSTAAHLAFTATCIVELFGLDQEASYAHAFTVRRPHDHMRVSMSVERLVAAAAMDQYSTAPQQHCKCTVHSVLS